MATILLTWELGGGRGHLGPLQQVAARLHARGHRVVLASRDVVTAGELFAEMPVDVFPAPVLPATPRYAISPVRSYMDILHNVGFGSAQHLRALSAAWLSIYGVVRPDAIVFDHSPTALAASYVTSTRRIVMGTGFACPPPGRECEDMRVWLANQEASNSRTGVLESLNLMRQAHRLPPLETVGKMFAAVDATVLATLPELDHFGARESARYNGVLSMPAGGKPEWPCASHSRAFAYLKPHRLLDGVVAELTRQRIATILYTGSDDPEVVRRYSTNFVRVSPSVLDLRAAMAESDFSILNGTHATTVAALLAGKPTLQFPLVLEQWLLAHRVSQMDAGAIVASNEAKPLSESLRRVAAGEGAVGAAAFAAKYGEFNGEAGVTAVVETIESALAG